MFMVDDMRHFKMHAMDQLHCKVTQTDTHLNYSTSHIEWVCHITLWSDFSAELKCWWWVWCLQQWDILSFLFVCLFVCFWFCFCFLFCFFREEDSTVNITDWPLADVRGWLRDKVHFECLHHNKDKFYDFFLLYVSFQILKLIFETDKNYNIPPKINILVKRINVNVRKRKEDPQNK